MSDPRSSTCGIGAPAAPGDPCFTHYGPKDAGSGVFAGIDSSSAVAAMGGAGALLAALIFAAFVARFVGGFFSVGKKAPAGRSLRERNMDPFSYVVRDHLAAHPELLQKGDANDLDKADDVELDAEDDTESETDEAEWDSDSPGAKEKFQ